MRGLVDAVPGGRGKGRSYWAGVSDQQLEGTIFAAADPEKLENLLDAVPPGDEVPEVEFTYDTRFTGTGMVRCIHCKKVAKNHNKGFVLRFADGSRMLFGKDCGEKQYGATFVHYEREFHAAMKKGEALRRRRTLLEARSTLIGALEAIEADNCWEAYGRIKRDFVAAFPDLIDELAIAALRRDGALYADVQVPDRESEARYEERTGRRVPMTKKIHDVVHRLSGRDFYDPKPLPLGLVHDLVSRAKSALWQLSEEGKSERDLNSVFQGLGKIALALDHEARRMEDLPRVFDEANIGGISQWLEAQSIAGEQLRLFEGRLFRCTRKGTVKEFYPGRDLPWRRAQMTVPATWPIAPLDQLTEFARAIGAPEQKSAVKLEGLEA